jgi:hypothetical protein
MKKLLLLILLFSTIIAKSQTTLNVFTFCVSPPITTTADSVLLSGTLIATDGYSSVKWSVVSGPNTPIMVIDTNTFQNTMLEQTLVWFKGLVAGTYTVQATGTSSTGTTKTLQTTFTILPIPTPIITSISIQLFGQTFVIPAGEGTKVIINGTAQSY